MLYPTPMLLSARIIHLKVIRDQKAHWVIQDLRVRRVPWGQTDLKAQMASNVKVLLDLKALPAHLDSQEHKEHVAVLALSVLQALRVIRGPWVLQELQDLRDWQVVLEPMDLLGI